MKVILLLHYYEGEKYLGQAMHWVELNSSNALAALISLLGMGRWLLQGTEDFPSEGMDYLSIYKALEEIFICDYHDFSGAPKDWINADTIRVIQVIKGWPFKKPVFSWV